MFLKTSQDSIKTVFKYLTKLKITKNLLHKLGEATQGKSIVYFSLHRVLADGHNLVNHPHYINKTAFSVKQIYHILKESKKNFQFVSMNESLELLKGDQPLTTSSAVLIIETPFYQTLKLLIPIIEELAIPACVMLSEHSLQSGEMLWMDDVVYRLGITAKKELSLNYLDRSFPLTSPLERSLASMHVVDHLSHARPAVLHQRLLELRQVLNDNALADTSERICTVNYLQKLADHKLLSYACAGAFHTPFFEIDLDSAKLEIVNAKEQLRAWFGQALVPVFFYPLGFDKRYNKELIAMLLDNGYQAALGRTVGICHPGDNLFRLKRLALSHHARDFSQFEIQAWSEVIDEFLLVSLAKDKKL